MENFEYKLKEKSLESVEDSFLKYYLNTLDIHKIDSFIMEPDSGDQEPPENLENMEEICDELHYGFENNKKFFIQVDSDADGITSSAIFYNYFRKLYPDARMEYRVHEGKEHGMFIDTVPIDADYIIIPDAGSNQFDEQRTLSEQGRKVLVMDHHHVDHMEQIKNVVIVNNQTSKEFKNKYLSGAGVVYKVIQHYDKLFNDNQLHQEYTDLAAVGIISDMMDTRELDNNYIIYHGLRNIRNPLLKAILKKQEYSVSSIYSPNKIDIAFYITPLINAVIRKGTLEENIELFEGFITQDNNEIFERTWRGKTISENYYEKIAREAGNIRNRQNTIKLKAFNFLDQRIQENKMYEDPIIAVETSRNDEITVPKTMTGLVAMELVKKYKKPVLVLRPKKIDGKEFLFGSGRASKTEGFDSFRDELNNSKLMQFAQGHDMAFGAGIEKSRLPELLTKMEEQLEGVDFGSDTIEVDNIFYGNAVNERMLREFAEVMNIYGNGIAQPKFAFEFMVSSSSIKVMGKKEDAIKIELGSVNLIKFKDTDAVNFLQNNEGEMLKVRAVGRSQINEFMGRKSTQVILDYIDIQKEEVEMMF